MQRLLFALMGLLLAMSAAGTSAVELQPDRVTIDEGRGAYTLPDGRLPYRWDRDHRHGGTASFEFALAPPAEPGPQAIYLPRVGNSYRVWIDGALIADNTGPGIRWVNSNQVPRLVALPESAGIAGSRLRIDINALSGADGGLSAVVQGSASHLGQVHASDSAWRTGGALAVTAISLVLGTLALLVWHNQRESLYLWYAAAELFWSMRTAGHYLTDTMLLPWPWWGALMLGLYVCAFGSMCYFGLTLVGRQGGAWGAMVKGFLALSALLIALSFALDMHALWRSWRFAILAVSAASAGVVLYAAWTQRSREAMVLAAVCGVALLAGLRDWLVITVAKNYYTAVPAMTYVWLVFGLAMAWLLAHRLRAATQAQAHHAHELAVRLAAQERELAVSFDAQRQVSEQQAASRERRQVLQDMHDGVGHELLGALQVAQEQEAPREAVTGQIQRAMDHLKLTVDVLQEGAQDVGAILGLLRYRLAPRLQACGIAVGWQVAPIPSFEDWDTRKARDLQLLLYEAFSNLLAHSRATRMHFEAQFDDASGVLRLLLADNGQGLRESGAQGNGLASMRTRAARLGGALTISNGALDGYPGLALELRLANLRRAAQAGAVIPGLTAAE